MTAKAITISIVVERPLCFELAGLAVTAFPARRVARRTGATLCFFASARRAAARLAATLWRAAAVDVGLLVVVVLAGAVVVDVERRMSSCRCRAARRARAILALRARAEGVRRCFAGAAAERVLGIAAVATSFATSGPMTPIAINAVASVATRRRVRPVTRNPSLRASHASRSAALPPEARHIRTGDGEPRVGEDPTRRPYRPSESTRVALANACPTIPVFFGERTFRAR
jgi:hypothetical protein